MLDSSRCLHPSELVTIAPVTDDEEKRVVLEMTHPNIDCKINRQM